MLCGTRESEQPFALTPAALSFITWSELPVNSFIVSQSFHSVVGAVLTPRAAQRGAFYRQRGITLPP